MFFPLLVISPARLCRRNVATLPLLRPAADLVFQHARKTHSPRDYTRMAEPILLEIQQRDQDILEYLSTGLETPLAS